MSNDPPTSADVYWLTSCGFLSLTVLNKGLGFRVQNSKGSHENLTVREKTWDDITSKSKISS